jgi:hypothetical protein
VANQTGVIPVASFQSATATNHPLLVGKPQARLIKMAKLTTPILQKRKRLAPVKLATGNILLVMVLLWCVLYQGKRISKSIDNRVLRHHHVEINNQREQSAYSYYP